METVGSISRRLLQEGEVKVVIGYGEGPLGAIRALFARRPEDADRLIYDSRCKQNLAVYLRKPEVKRLGKAALVALPSVVRTVVQLAAEKQIADTDVRLIAVASRAEPVILDTLPGMEVHLATLEAPVVDAEDQARLAEISALGVEERWQYWQERLSRCFKCYACRAACPLCYCSRCTAELNQPQFISVSSTALGNLEWHVMRAMHLAGRCVGCGECSRACPVGIPVHLLSQKLNQEMLKRFGSSAGTKVGAEHALSVFRPDDREDFIR